MTQCNCAYPIGIHCKVWTLNIGCIDPGTVLQRGQISKFKFSLNLSKFLIIHSQQNFAHVTTALLLWHVKYLVVILCLNTEQLSFYYRMILSRVASIFSELIPRMFYQSLLRAGWSWLTGEIDCALLVNFIWHHLKCWLWQIKWYYIQCI